MFRGFFKPKDLWTAAKHGDTEVIKELVAAGHDLSARKAGFVRDGFTPLHIAVVHEQKEAIKVLVELGADINAKNKDGETPLEVAVSELRHPDVGEFLIELGAKVDVRNSVSKLTPLDWSAFDGKVEMVRMLLTRGANPNAGRGSSRSAPIQQAANSGNVEILKLLLEAGADVNAMHAGSHALGTAATFGHFRFVKMLLESGANPNLPDESGTTPLMCGVAGRNIEIVKLLVDAGAKFNAVRFHGNAETALDFAEDNKATKTIADYLRGTGAKRASELTASETSPPAQEEPGIFWQLRDDSTLEATVEPWPPQSDAATLKVEISPNGHDPTISFVGKLEYRVAPTEDNVAPWKPMKPGRKDDDNNVCFSETVTLPKGTAFIQFRVQADWENEPTVLKEWRVEVNDAATA
ncbi:MAG TPA: ankyrin repeat domain-containing protein [Verrucomicrobiae bacterium]|nr:ankyrin repeat domain-containing protein [Verrucomicrobiae bacterium]